jgi:hypothetical protein
MTGNQNVRFIDQYRVRESEFPDRSDELLDLAFGMGPGIARIRLKRADRPVLDL